MAPGHAPAGLRRTPGVRRAAWEFGLETSIQALRLMGSGLFDEYPKLRVILGHLGEGTAVRHLARRSSNI